MQEMKDVVEQLENVNTAYFLEFGDRGVGAALFWQSGYSDCVEPAGIPPAAGELLPLTSGEF